MEPTCVMFLCLQSFAEEPLPECVDTQCLPSSILFLADEVCSGIILAGCTGIAGKNSGISRTTSRKHSE